MCKLHGNHKQKSIVNTQKIMRKESKHTTRKRKTAREERYKGTTKQPENNLKNGSKYVSINNYFNVNKQIK